MSKLLKPELRKTDLDALREQGYWAPLPGPQQLAIALSRDRRYREILYGGARGGGKTDVSIAIIGDRFRDRRTKQLVIRRNAEDLSDFEDRASQAYQVFGAKLRRHPMVISGKRTGRVLGGHLRDDDAYTKYQGHEYSRINIEELTQIPKESMYEKLISSARSKYSDLFPQIFNTANPGGVGMGWVKARFVTPDRTRCEVLKHEYHWTDVKGKPQVTHWQTIIERETGIWRAYIPATIDSNPILLESDPLYVQQLESLKNSDPELYEAWRWGNWDIQFGAVFEEFRKNKHVFRRFSDWGIDREHFDGSWKIMGMDWGYNDECVCLYATFDEISDGQERAFIYREKHDNHKHPEWWAKEIAAQQDKEPVDVIALPHDAYSHLGGTEPISEIIKRELKKLPVDKQPKIVRADKLNRDLKKASIYRLHDMFADAPDGKPGIQIHQGCEYLIDTLPMIVYAKDGGGEELDKNNEDHALDALFYTIMTANKVRGKLYNPAYKLKKTQLSYVAGKGVTYKDLGMDVQTMVKSAARAHKRKDWKTT